MCLGAKRGGDDGGRDDVARAFARGFLPWGNPPSFPTRRNEAAPQNAPDEVTSGFLVAVEKVDVFELAERYPEAFGWSYDPDEGVDLQLDSGGLKR